MTPRTAKKGARTVPKGSITKNPVPAGFPIDDPFVDCILATTTEYAAKEDMIRDAKTNLGQALNDDSFDVLHLPSCDVVANPRGSIIAELAVRTTRLEDSMKSLKADHAELKADHADLQVRYDARFKELEISRFSTIGLRHRFLSTYKRDILKNDDANDRAYIKERNQVAHSGDCKWDVMLYVGLKARCDYASFEMIYGLPPDVVLSMYCENTLAVCNKYATVTADLSLEIPSTFYEAFQEFIAALKANRYPDDYLTTQKDPYNAWAKFWKALGDVRKKDGPSSVSWESPH